MKLKALQDYSSTGKKRKWKEHKVANELLTLAYDTVNPDKAVRLRACATQLSFEKAEQEKAHLRLVGAWFCRVRLCPMCSWRRSLKVGAQMRKIISAIQAEEPKEYILLTLTVRNCSGTELNETITKFLQAFNSMAKTKPFKDVVCGYYRSMELTHNLQNDTFHPHIHAILAVEQSYFKSPKYLSQEKWTSLWKHTLKVDYTPIVDVRKISRNISKGVAEVAKYAVKSEEYIIPDDWDLTIETVRLLDAVLHNRRFVAFGGIFKDYHKKLNLDDAETGDLVSADIDTPTTDMTGEHIVNAIWYSGYRQYYWESKEDGL